MPCGINGILTGTLAGAVPPFARPPVYGLVYSLDNTTAERDDTTEEHDVELEEYDEIIRNLVQIAAHQNTINEDLRAFNRQQGEINARLTAAIERLDMTLEAIKDILRRGNGR